MARKHQMYSLSCWVVVDKRNNPVDVVAYKRRDSEIQKMYKRLGWIFVKGSVLVKL
jgi:hypothetical protein